MCEKTRCADTKQSYHTAQKRNGKLDLNDVKYIDKSDLSKLNRSKLLIGDMLFTYVGTFGHVALIEENDRYYLAPNVALI